MNILLVLLYNDNSINEYSTIVYLTIINYCQYIRILQDSILSCCRILAVIRVFVSMFFFLFLCNYLPTTRTIQALITNDIVFLIGAILFGLSSGVFSSLAMMYAPRCVSVSELIFLSNTVVNLYLRHNATFTEKYFRSIELKNVITMNLNIRIFILLCT